MKDNRSSNARNAILNSINNLIESSSKNNPYDKTFIGRITSNNGNNYYNVSINGKIYENIKGLPLFNFNMNDIVYCLAPQGNMNQLRVILCLNNTNLFNNINIKGTFTALDSIKGFSISDATNVGLDLGRQDGTGGTPYIDFHTDGNSSTDYNSRLIAISDYLNVVANGGLKVNNMDVICINDANLNLNGYIKYNNGLVIEWGSFTPTGTNADSDQAANFCAFPLTFSTCYQVVAVFAGINLGSSYNNTISINTIQSNGFYVRKNFSETNRPIRYIAIGII